MKNNLLAFLLGGAVFVSLAASTTNLMTVKPAMPKSTFAKQYYSNQREDMHKDCIELLKQGYIIKVYAISGYSNVPTLVMEKY